MLLKCASKWLWFFFLFFPVCLHECVSIRVCCVWVCVCVREAHTQFRSAAVLAHCMRLGELAPKCTLHLLEHFCGTAIKMLCSTLVFEQKLSSHTQEIYTHTHTRLFIYNKQQLSINYYVTTERESERWRGGVNKLSRGLITFCQCSSQNYFRCNNDSKTFK